MRQIDEKIVNVEAFNGEGPSFTIGSIRVDEPLDKMLREGVRYEICPVYGPSNRYGNPVELKRFNLAPIPAKPATPKEPEVQTLSAAELVVDYEMDEMVQDETGLKVYYKKKKRTVEQLERLLELARHENHELKTRLNAVTDEYKLGWNAAKDEIVSTVKHLEGPT